MSADGRPAVDLDLDVPPDFHEVPLALAVEDRVEAQRVLVESLDLDPERREGLGWFLESIAHDVRGSAVVGTAFCAVEIDGEPSAATLTVATVDVPSDDPLVLAQGVRELLGRRPAGAPAVHDAAVELERVGGRTLVVQRVTAATPGDEATSTYRTTAVAGIPGQHLGVVVTVTTGDRAHADTYADVARSAAASVRVAG